MTTQQIEQGRHILKMIEGFAGYTEAEILRDHKETLDEIDARFWCFEKGYEFVTTKKRMFVGFQYLHKNETRPYIEDAPQGWVKQVTRSRDALKSARPDGWTLTSEQSRLETEHYEGWRFNLGTACRSPLLPTEELAELHAITQARIWELENGGNNA